MGLSIDHVVIASDDLDRAIAGARAAGFTVVPGGVHGSGHTHNALIGFADGSYLELFAPTPQGRSAEHRWFPRIRNGGGLVDFCLLGAGLAATVADIRRRGIAYSEPFAMARRTPAGERVEWLLATPPGRNGEHGWPFFIEDTTPRAIRVPHLPDEIGHANGARAVAGITVLVRDLAASAAAYEAILGTAPSESSPEGDSRLFRIDGAWILLRGAETAEEQEHLARHGQGPVRLVLRSTERAAGPEAGVLLDAALFSGARLAIA